MVTTDTKYQNHQNRISSNFAIIITPLMHLIRWFSINTQKPNITFSPNLIIFLPSSPFLLTKWYNAMMIRVHDIWEFSLSSLLAPLLHVMFLCVCLKIVRKHKMYRLSIWWEEEFVYIVFWMSSTYTMCSSCTLVSPSHFPLTYSCNDIYISRLLRCKKSVCELGKMWISSKCMVNMNSTECCWEKKGNVLAEYAWFMIIYRKKFTRWCLYLFNFFKHLCGEIKGWKFLIRNYFKKNQ